MLQTTSAPVNWIKKVFAFKLSKISILYFITKSYHNQLCPSEVDREDVRSEVKEDIQSILRNNTLPQLNLDGHSETNPAASCNELLGRGQNSGYYWIRANGNSAVQVYCDMNRHCCNSTGGWTRVAYLNMTDPTQQCPDEWREVNQDLQKSCSFLHKFSCIQHIWDTLQPCVWENYWVPIWNT